jgi:hypothetical protein
MNTTKIQRLQLALPTISIPKFFCKIIVYVEHHVSQVICKEVTDFIDSATERLKLVDNSSLRRAYEERMVETVNSRILRCVNLSSIDLSWDLPYCFECHHFRVLNQLQISPRIVEISTDIISNWMVSTSLGTKLYNTYSLSEALSINDVLEIVLRCIVARDCSTLSRFGATPSDLLMTSGFVCIVPSSIHFLDGTTVESCLHSYNGGSRQVQLRLNNNNTWEVSSISEKVDFDGLECIHGN